MKVGRTFLTLCLAATAGFAARREVAITFDDLPSTRMRAEDLPAVTKKLLSTITANRIPVTGFVNEQKLYMEGKLDPRRVDLLRQWIAAGADLGNHTFSHVAIDRVPLEEYQRDVIRGETVTKSLLSARGKNLRYFRHPQLRTGPDDKYRRDLDAFLKQRNYANELNADYFDELVSMMKRRGYRFISLEEALKDPAYKSTEAQSKRGLSWLQRWMLAKGLALKPEPAEPEFIRRLCNEVGHRPSVSERTTNNEQRTTNNEQRTTNNEQRNSVHPAPMTDDR